MRTFRLLDLFCGAGGAAMGYHRAGFEVVGVDIKPQPHYPFEFHQSDAMTYPLDGFDAIHASPPCQAYSSMTRVREDHDDLYAPTRVRLIEADVPYVIENVIGAPYDHGVVLCGSMFQPDRAAGWVQRHRNFETSWFIFQPECDHRGRPRPFTITGHLSGRQKESCYPHSRKPKGEDVLPLMGMPWATIPEAVLAIPPAYTEWIGKQLLEHLTATGAPQRLVAIPLDLALADRPRLPDEPGVPACAVLTPSGPSGACGRPSSRDGGGGR